MVKKTNGLEHKTTLKDIAQRVGVHVSTVSRALNIETRDLVNVELVELITQTALELKYKPSSLARNLRKPTLMTVGIILPDISNAVFPVLVQAIETTLSKQGYSTLIAHAESDYPRKSTLIDQLASRRIDGLILTTARRHHALVDFCLASRIPLVMVSRTEKDSRVSSVINDDMASMALSVKHLADLGHKRIAHIGGPADMSTGVLRHKGFLLAMRKHKLEPCAIVRSQLYSREEGVACAEQVLSLAPDTTAIVTANDLLAVGCLEYLKTSGQRCPEDVSVVGHNDMPLVDIIAPPLTTVRINYKQMGTEAALLMLKRLEDPNADALMTTLRPKLIVRGSTAKIG